MTDPTPRRPAPPPALEPWALDLLEKETGRDPRAREETERVVALLQQLDAPPNDPERLERLLRSLEARRARPRVIRAAFGAARRLASPPVALALAAGMAGLVAVTWAPTPLSVQPGRDAPDGGTEIAAARPEAALAVPVRRRATPVIRPQLVNISAFSPPSISRHVDAERDFVLGLDRQLNQLMIDPEAFASQLERTTAVQRDRNIARLAERAAERGDATEIALRVRHSQHPLARRIVDRMLNATMVASFSRR